MVQTMNLARYKALLSKMMKAKSFMKPEKLHASSSALKFHSYETYYQVMEWLSLENNIVANEWSWMNINSWCILKTTGRLPAKETLLKIIHCKCTLDCQNLRCD